jgi:hypothetical protein
MVFDRLEAALGIAFGMARSLVRQRWHRTSIEYSGLSLSVEACSERPQVELGANHPQPVGK